jgi:AcrR family transcriptional regulator
VKRGEARSELLLAARELFAERGYQAATTKDIAERAGVSEVLIYRYFESKAGLLDQSVVQPVVAILDAFIDAWNTNAAQRARSTDALVRDFVEILLDVATTNRNLLISLIRTLMEAPGESQDLAGIRTSLINLFATLGHDADGFLAGRDLRADDAALTTRLAVLLVLSASIVLPMTYDDAKDAPDRDQLAEELSRLLTFGLQRPE